MIAPRPKASENPKPSIGWWIRAPSIVAVDRRVRDRRVDGERAQAE
jgi:hypothetical protein